MKRLYRYRFIALAVVAAGLIAATVILMLSNEESGLAGRLGPTPGPDSQGHIEARRAYLTRIASEDPEQEAAALVSLSALTSARDATSVLGDAAPTAVFVQFPGHQAEALPVETTIESTVGDRADELTAQIQAEIDAITDEAEKEKRRDALASLGPGCACVFAIALEDTTLGDLAEIQELPEVRLVDVPDPVVDSLEGWELTPILPRGTPAPSTSASPSPQAP
ncbi:MAG: hypothetical protein WD646_03600 [Actinomycetota bacterium]